ncbi:MAG: type 4a pilus biogenesis protein PilO [Acidobacteriota bacterium]|nr:type 4a pilus biogenesis protein PilO [Acidobacteriota bacterium]
MAFQTGLEGKPWYFGLIAGLVVGGILYFGAHRMLLKPKKTQIASLEGQVTTLQAKIQEGRAAQQQLPRFREEVRQLELELDKLLRILPARRNTPELMRRIRTLTEQGDFNLLSFKPGGYVEQEFYSEWPIAINLQGTYHNLAQFFEKVGRFSRIINIESLRVSVLSAVTGSDHTISATFNATTFVYKEDLEEVATP